jgi:hypothetical protein
VSAYGEYRFQGKKAYAYCAALKKIPPKNPLDKISAGGYKNIISKLGMS